MNQQSAAQAASSSLSSALNRLWRRGWFSSWPSADDGQSVLYASFHLHPEDADAAEAALQAAIANYGGKTAWTLIRQQENRFVLCPTDVANEAEGPGNLGEAAKKVQGRHPEAERQAASDLSKLVEYLETSARGTE